MFHLKLYFLHRSILKFKHNFKILLSNTGLNINYLETVAGIDRTKEELENIGLFVPEYLTGIDQG